MPLARIGAHPPHRDRLLDTAAVEAVDSAVWAAKSSAHVPTLDLTHISTITASALNEVLTRDSRSRDATP